MIPNSSTVTNQQYHGMSFKILQAKLTIYTNLKKNKSKGA